MTEQEILAHLLTWTPYLLGGFAMNIWISLLAMLIGSGIGWALALLRLSQHSGGVRASLVATELSRNIPTIVFQFYLAFMLPSEILLPFFKYILVIPVWIKAALALSIAVIGFTSDNLTIAIADWQQGDHHAAFLFIPSWTSYALIIVMASSTASIIGVSELVSRCNTVINANGNTELMLPVYLYACLFFFCFCYPLTLLMKRVSKHLKKKYGMPDS